jgi:hypothetical protein
VPRSQRIVATVLVLLAMDYDVRVTICSGGTPSLVQRRAGRSRPSSTGSSASSSWHNSIAPAEEHTDRAQRCLAAAVLGSCLWADGEALEGALLAGLA